MAPRKSELSTLKNVGPVSEGWLNDAGIYTYADLETLGAVEAYKRVKELYPKRVSLNMLYGLQATLMNIKWTELPQDIKDELKTQVSS